MTTSTTWISPANIALVKYWGKYGNQLPQNPSVSMTLAQSNTTTQLTWTRASGKPHHTFLYAEHKAPAFEKRVFEYIHDILWLIPELKEYSLQIKSENNFPHSSGISSSASFMSSLALCLMDAIGIITGNKLEPGEFHRKASILARLGSGSASRSIYGGFALWGHTDEIPGSSDEFAVSMNPLVHPVFKTYRDAILIVSSRVKSLLSSAGHHLMDDHAFATARYTSARENILSMISILRSGDQENFIRLVEEEAMTLHGLIQTSAGGPILMEPGTLAIIRSIRNFRSHTGNHLCFTLDAGPNIHLLYPENESETVRFFIENALLQYCEDRKWIDDHIGSGPFQ